jgi:hypothetical protein
MNKICCFGDGYAANHIWPEWPAIIEALYPTVEFSNHGAVGAGNEFISSSIIKEHRKNPDAVFLIQWAPNGRLDKLIEDNSWDHVIESDKVYHFNRVVLDEQTWWLSSASVQETIQHYHQYYIQPQQDQHRNFNTIYLITKLLAFSAVHFSTYSLNFTPQQWTDLQSACWIDTDMSSYSNQHCFLKIRQREIQPSPPVHMQWVIEKLLPCMPVQPDTARLTELTRRINAETWIPYDPDRREIWSKLIDF